MRPKTQIGILIALWVFVFSIELVSAYTTPLNMPSLWDVFVEQIFGSFWVAVLFIAMFFMIIFMIGKVNFYTSLVFIMEFFLAMALGYGNALVAFAIIMFGAVGLLYQFWKYLSGF